MNATAQPTAPSKLMTSFEDIKARVGDMFQVQISTDRQEIRHSVKLVGYVVNKTIIITTPTVNNSLLLLREGQNLTVRAFSGTAAYAFSCEIIKVCNSPLAYLHLSYPKAVQKVPIRASARINFDLKGTSVNTTHGDNAPAIPVLITDISTTGAAIAASTPLGKKDDVLLLDFCANIRDIEVHPTIKCIIRSLTSSDDKINPIKYGLQFVELQTQELLTLQSLVYQKILEDK